MRFYKGCTAENIDENVAIFTEFERLKSVMSERKKDDKFHLKDFRKDIVHIKPKIYFMIAFYSIEL